MKKVSGAQIIIESLIAEGANVIFGFPGGAILPTYDALLDSPLKHVLVRHEQGATHMAEGYARVSGRPGVVIVTSGPGATNAVTGIVDAYMDSTPLVVISGQVSTSLIGNDAFQEADIVGITRPCTKHNFLVKDVRDLARYIKEAFYIAGTGRPGPVLIDVPKDVQQAEHRFSYPERVELRGYKPTIKGNPRQIERAIDAIERSDAPLFYVGGGVQWSGAAPELTQLVRGLGIPVCETLMGLGSFPASDPLCLGMLGMHGSYGTNTAVCNTDCLIAVGARFDDRVTGRIADSLRRPKPLSIWTSTLPRSRRMCALTSRSSETSRASSRICWLSFVSASRSVVARPIGPSGMSRSCVGSGNGPFTKTVKCAKAMPSRPCT